MNLSRGSLKTLALTAAVVFLHLMFVNIAGYPLTLAPFAVPVFLLASYKFRFPKSTMLVWSALLVVPFVNLPFFGSTADVAEFLRTYLLWTFTVTAVLFASRAGLRLDSRWVSRGAFLSLVIVALYSVAQNSLYKYLSLDTLYNPFGDHQYLYQYDLALYANAPRAPGFYLEPSFNAFIVTSMLFIALASNYRSNAALILSGIALCFIQALSGFLVYGFLLLGYMALHRSSRKFWAGFVISVFALTGMYFSGLGDFLVERTVSASVEGTSTSYRVIAPLAVLKDVLLNYPTGRSFGTVEETMLDYGLLNGKNPGSSLDNGIYLLTFYFGWLAIGAAVLTILARALFYRGWWTLSTLYLTVYILLSMLYTGGILSPEYVFITILVIYVWRTSRVQESKVTKTKVTFAAACRKSFPGRELKRLA